MRITVSEHYFIFQNVLQYHFIFQYVVFALFKENTNNLDLFVVIIRH